MTMEEWAKERTCAKCGKTFSLPDHGHVVAQSAAQSLEAGSFHPDSAPDIAARCPACCGAPGMTEAEAIAATMRMQQDMDRSSGRERYAFARLAAALIAMFSLAVLVMLRRYMWLRQGEYAAGRVYAFLLIAVLILAVATYVWAFVQSRKLKR